MLEAFASVGATEFDITWTNIEEAPKRFQSHRSVAELRTGMAERLEVASRLRCNVINSLTRERVRVRVTLQLTSHAFS
jgi:hypothetical protein